MNKKFHSFIKNYEQNALIYVNFKYELFKNNIRYSIFYITDK